MVSGYLHPLYPQSLSEFGIPRELPGSGGWILEREIEGVPYRDAMGCYPMFVCKDWAQLAPDLDDLGHDLVSLSLVTDPFGNYNEIDLRRCFEVVIPFKEHYIVDLQRPMNEYISRNSRRYARKAMENVQIEICEEPIRYIDEWTALYAALMQRHNVTGIRAFSRTAFLKQLSIPGLVMFRALQGSTAVGAALTFIQGDTAYGHLLGISEAGHELGVSYAIYWAHISYLLGKVHWMDWGGTPGIANNGSDGLSQFKRGWSTETRTVYFCGRIFDQDKYSEIMKAKGLSGSDYFPAYRKGEFD